MKFEITEHKMQGSPVLKRMLAKLEKDSKLLEFRDMRPSYVDLNVRFALGGIDKLHGYRLIGDPNPDVISSITLTGHKQMRARYSSEESDGEIGLRIEQRWFMHGVVVLVDRRLARSSRYLTQFSECCANMERFLLGLSTTLGKGSGALDLTWRGDMKTEISATPMRFTLWTRMIRDHGKVTYGIQPGGSATEDALNWP